MEAKFKIIELNPHSIEPFQPVKNRKNAQSTRQQAAEEVNEVHVVIKNSPFRMKLGLELTHEEELMREAFIPLGKKLDYYVYDAILVYDCEGNKEVDYVSTKPVSIKATLDESSENNIDIELKMKVLTSQHEGMLFKVKIQALDPNTQQPVAGLYVFTPPIRVISKPDQLMKRPPTKKRTLNEMLYDTVVRIEQQQEAHHRQMMQMTETVARGQQRVLQAVTTPTIPVQIAHPQIPQEPATSLKEVIKDKNPERNHTVFADAFETLLKSYMLMPADERAESIRKIVRSKKCVESEALFEMLDLFAAQANEAQFGKSLPFNEHWHQMNFDSSALVKQELLSHVDVMHEPASDAEAMENFCENLLCYD